MSFGTSFLSLNAGFLGFALGSYTSLLSLNTGFLGFALSRHTSGLTGSFNPLLAIYPILACLPLTFESQTVILGTAGIISRLLSGFLFLGLA